MMTTEGKHGVATLLEAEGLTKHYGNVARSVRRSPARVVHAVCDVDLEVRRGETLGLVGESGCGKSTLGRMLVGLVQPSGGRLCFAGADVTIPGSSGRTLLRRRQMVFQDPMGSLDPGMKLGASIEEGLAIHKIGSRSERRDRVVTLLREVGLAPDMADRYPHECSGGERQRVGIARALAVEPEFVVADEPVSALDVSVQAQLLNLLVRLKGELGLTLVFIGHNLAVVGYVSDRIAVMYLGKVVELADASDFFTSPLHPYTVALLEAVPRRGEGEAASVPIRGELASAVDPPSGCRYRTRCPMAGDICRDVVPPLMEAAPEHWVACHFAGQMPVRA
ncbi:MAG: ABC transporter ATP-binding protein [Acidimicrobiales bacterium]